MMAEPDDAATGRLLTRLGGMETLGLLDRDGKVPGLNRVDGRDHLTAASRPMSWPNASGGSKDRGTVS